VNLLAHLYLSGADEQRMIGNFIADHVRGATIHRLPPEIQQGVQLHRKIDHYTDHHPVVAETKTRLRPVVGKYAPVVADIYYDHFLARNWSRFSDTPLEVFARSFYKLITEYDEWIPERTKRMLSYMISGNWLVSYAEIDGIDRVLKGMSRRASFENGMDWSGVELKKNYSGYHDEFNRFFPDLIRFTESETGESVRLSPKA
jgi:acyl carrier protein phosphodiesterase